MSTVSTVTADRTGKFVLLTYRLRASHCSTEAHLAGVSFPRSFDASERSRLIHRFCVLIKAFLVKKKGTKSSVLSRVAKFRSVVFRCVRGKLHTALDCYSNNPEHLLCSPCALGSPYIES